MNSNNYHPECIHPIYRLYTVTQMNYFHITRPYLIHIIHVMTAHSLKYLQKLATCGSFGLLTAVNDYNTA
jgi:hypothetical protein